MIYACVGVTGTLPSPPLEIDSHCMADVTLQDSCTGGGSRGRRHGRPNGGAHHSGWDRKRGPLYRWTPLSFCAPCPFSTRVRLITSPTSLHLSRPSPPPRSKPKPIPPILLAASCMPPPSRVSRHHAHPAHPPQPAPISCPSHPFRPLISPIPAPSRPSHPIPSILPSRPISPIPQSPCSSSGRAC